MSEPLITETANKRAAVLREPALSVCIPVYRDDPLPLLDQLAAQADDLTEIVILDDGTPEAGFNARLAEAIEGCDAPVRLITARSNIGRAAGRNLLARRARGPWCLFLDADMAIAPGFLDRWRAAIVNAGFDAAFGGARRDEEKSRAKERVFSFRTSTHRWDPKNQRPELWNLFNGRKLHGEHFRVFPLSNWTEMDVWQYIKAENIPLPNLYFAAERECFIRDKTILACTDFINLLPEEEPTVGKRMIRFRTIGDATCTGAVESSASTLDDIIDIMDAGLEWALVDARARALCRTRDAEGELVASEVGYF